MGARQLEVVARFERASQVVLGERPALVRRAPLRDEQQIAMLRDAAAIGQRCASCALVARPARASFQQGAHRAGEGRGVRGPARRGAACMVGAARRQGLVVGAMLRRAFEPVPRRVGLAALEGGVVQAQRREAALHGRRRRSRQPRELVYVLACHGEASASRQAGAFCPVFLTLRRPSAHAAQHGQIGRDQLAAPLLDPTTRGRRAEQQVDRARGTVGVHARLGLGPSRGRRRADRGCGPSGLRPRGSLPCQRDARDGRGQDARRQHEAKPARWARARVEARRATKRGCVHAPSLPAPRAARQRGTRRSTRSHAAATQQRRRALIGEQP